MGMPTAVDFGWGGGLALFPTPRSVIVRRLPLVRRDILQKARMPIVLGEQCFDFRPQPTVTRASLVEKRGPGIGLELTRSAKKVGDFPVSF